MPLPIYLTIAILLILYMFFMRKPLNFLHNSIIYMVIVFFGTQFITIVRMEFHLMEKSSGHLDYVSFLLYRNILLPAVVLIFLNYYLQQQAGKYKMVLLLFCTLLLAGLDWLNNYFGILMYTRWNLLFSVVVDVVYLLIALGVLKLLLKTNIRESNRDENI